MNDNIEKRKKELNRDGGKWKKGFRKRENV